MCGIVGAVGEMEPATLQKMLDKIAHRGPDNQDSLSIDDVHFGHARLSILDLSPNSNQPLWDVKRKFCIIFNGEIYNYQVLRKELLDLGYSFASNGDAEVIVNLFAHYGVDGLSKLNGIFSFAILDKNSQQVYLVRDRFGVKPMYFTSNSKGVYFASELKALLSLENVAKDLNFDAIFRSVVFLWSPGPDTIVDGVNKLEPGHYLVIQNKKIVKNARYVKEDRFFEQKYSKKRAKSLVEDSLLGSIRDQLVADVPVGAFLSGGLDSSLIVAMAKELNTKQLQCYTIQSVSDGSGNDGFADDLAYAKLVAEYLDVDLDIVLADTDILKMLPQMIYHLDEPCGDPAALNVWMISEKASKSGKKVLFSGAGGDDIFSGYRRHQALAFTKMCAFMPKGFCRGLSKFANLLPVRKSFFRRARKLLTFAGLPENEQLLSYFYWIEPTIVRNLFTEDVKKKLSKDPLANILSEVSSLDDLPLLERMLYLEKKYFLIDHNFNYTDKMSMAHGVEVRVPYLDNKLNQVASGLPVRIKKRFGTTKWVLKQVARKYLPKNVIYRPKTGFGVPLRKWLQNDLHAMVEEFLSEESLARRGIFDYSAVRDLIEKDRAGKGDYSYPIFTLLCIEQWCRIFLDNPR